MPERQPSDARRRAWARRLAGAAAGWAILIGGLALLGWAWDVEFLKTARSGFGTMMPNAALGFILTGAALFVLRHDAPDVSRRLVASACAIGVTTIGALTLCEYGFGWQLGIDQALFQDLHQAAFSQPGRMSPTTAANFLLLGAALLLIDRRWARTLGPVVALTVFGVGFTALAGYLFGLRSPSWNYRLPTFMGMAATSALTFSLLAVGLVCARPERGPMALMTSATMGDVAVSRFLPVALLGQILLGWAKLEGQLSGLYETDMGAMLFALSSSFLIGGLLWWSATALHRNDVERTEAEAAVRESETRYRSMFEANPHPMWIYDVETLRFLAVNDTAVKNYGYSRDEFLAMTLKDIRPAEDVPELLESFGDHRRELVHAGHWRHRLGDGRIIVADITAHRLPFEGRPCEVVVAQNVTERARNEERLREQAALLDLARDAILVRDMNHVLTYWNRSAERLYGWTAEEAIGRSVVALLYKRVGGFRAAFEQVRQTGEWTGELEQVTKSGQALTVDSRWTLLRDAAGQPKSIFVINTDITTQKKLEQQFLRAQRLESIGILAGGIAHDLNNVLTPITMAADMLRDTVTEPPGPELLAAITRGSQRGAEMVRQVLTFARGLDGQPVEVAVGRLVADTETFARDTFPKNIQIRATVAAGTEALLGDPTQLEQVMLNLCVNARDAMPDGGSLSITAEGTTLNSVEAAAHLDGRAGRYVVLQVTDTGTGMPAAILNSIFDPFFTTKAPGQGTGLGLSTSRAIIKSHGGFISVYSEPGQGTRFCIYLPSQVGALHGGTDRATADEPKGHGETVLVVDDERPIREIARRALERAGFCVLLAADGAEAIVTYQAHQAEIAVVITDMMMPVMDGASTIRALQAINPAVRIIAASGLTTEGQASTTSPRGIAHFLPKPYNTAALLKVLSLALSDPS